MQETRAKQPDFNRRFRFQFLRLVNGLLVVLMVGFMWQSTGFSQANPLLRAHAHNDYEHPRPLLDALEAGFANVEVDVYRVGDELLVGHDREDLTDERTLQRLYLQPLSDRVKANAGKVFQTAGTLTLLIDIKSAGGSTYQRLAQVLADYPELFDSRTDMPAAVEVVISGNRDWDAILNDADRKAGVDGRLADLDRDLSAGEMPWISDRWSSHFDWRGDGPMPADQRQRLVDYVQQAHARGRRIRFWATPENPALWRELIAADVDLIGTDQLDRLARFLREEATEGAKSD